MDKLANEYDDTHGNRRPMDVSLLAEMARQFQDENQNTRFLAFQSTEYGPSVHVTYRGLVEIADPALWVWQPFGSVEQPHQAAVKAHGVEFFAILTDEERDEVLGDD